MPVRRCKSMEINGAANEKCRARMATVLLRAPECRLAADRNHREKADRRRPDAATNFPGRRRKQIHGCGGEASDVAGGVKAAALIGIDMRHLK